MARPPIDACAHRCKQLPLGSTVEHSREENRRVLQDGVRPPQLFVLAFALLETSTLVRRDSLARTGVDLRLSHPRTEGLWRHAEEFGNGAERGPLGWVV